MGVRSPKSQHGFGLVESMIAIFMITVGALSLATVFVGAAEQTRRASMRTKALEAASAQIDRLRSLSYDDVFMWQNDSAFNDRDWTTTYCPILDAGVQQCNPSVTGAPPATTIVTDAEQPTAARDPRQGKLTPGAQSYGSAASGATGPMNCLLTPPSGTSNYCGSSLVRQRGIILYTYIYWNNWKTPASTSQFKVITVVAKFLDPKTNADGTLVSATAPRYATVRLSAIVADVPEIGQSR